MNTNSNKENISKKDKKSKVLSEEEFNKELKKQVDNLEKIFYNYNQSNQKDEER